MGLGCCNKPIFLLLLCSSLLLSLFLSSSAQTSSTSCTTYSFSSNRLFNLCNTLAHLDAHLHWTYNSSKGTVDIAYRATQSSDGWVAWAINPEGLKMIGSQALVAHQNSSGVVAYPASITGYSVKESKLSFDASGIDAEYVDGQFIIYATLTLPGNATTVNQVWQAGTLSNGAPATHPMSGANVQSFGTLDFLSGQGTTSGGSNSRRRRRNVHGVLNAVSWGVLMPLGAIIARYMRVFKSADPAWFYFHVACQTSGYIVGVAGWGTGLKLGSDSTGIKYSTHRNIGIALFCLGTLQVFALLLRPKKDHKYRLYWNIYHHAVGYTVITLSIINIFKGFDILDPEKKWKRTYMGIIIALGAIAVILEAITWPIVLKRKSNSPEKSHHGANGANVYADRQGV